MRAERPSSRRAGQSPHLVVVGSRHSPGGGSSPHEVRSSSRIGGSSPHEVRSSSRIEGSSPHEARWASRAGGSKPARSAIVLSRRTVSLFRGSCTRFFPAVCAPGPPEIASAARQRLVRRRRASVLALRERVRLLRGTSLAASGRLISFSEEDFVLFRRRSSAEQGRSSSFEAVCPSRGGRCPPRGGRCSPAPASASRHLLALFSIRKRSLPRRRRLSALAERHAGAAGLPSAGPGECTFSTGDDRPPKARSSGCLSVRGRSFRRKDDRPPYRNDRSPCRGDDRFPCRDDRPPPPGRRSPSRAGTIARHRADDTRSPSTLPAGASPSRMRLVPASGTR